MDVSQEGSGGVGVGFLFPSSPWKHLTALPSKPKQPDNVLKCVETQGVEAGELQSKDSFSKASLPGGAPRGSLSHGAYLLENLWNKFELPRR